VHDFPSLGKGTAIPYGAYDVHRNEGMVNVGTTHDTAEFAEVLGNDDTSMRVLRLARQPSDKRTGVFTSGIVSTRQGRQIAPYFTGRQHAGENLADVLKERAAELPAPIQMSDALSRNVPKLPGGVEILLANCLAHGRRQFVEIVQNFPAECRYGLEMLGHVYRFDAEARERGLTAMERLHFHQQHSGPVMNELHRWLEMQLTQKKAEPNSGLGQAITYLLRPWRGLTAFLREPNAPLDNNLCERALKKMSENKCINFWAGCWSSNRHETGPVQFAAASK
jgi:transposase